MVSELNELRMQLQQIDEQLIRLLAQRQRISRQIGRVKHALNLDIEQTHVWKQQQQQRRYLATELNVDQSLITSVFDEIHAFSKAVQQQTQSE
jgi:chorismate mutase